MAFFEDVVVTESLPIKTTREKLFTYLTGIVDDESFKTLNAKNVSYRWLKGRPWTAGSVAYAEKYLHGKLHKFEFIIETNGDRCRFISATGPSARMGMRFRPPAGKLYLLNLYPRKTLASRSSRMFLRSIFIPFIHSSTSAWLRLPLDASRAYTLARLSSSPVTILSKK